MTINQARTLIHNAGGKITTLRDVAEILREAEAECVRAGKAQYADDEDDDEYCLQEADCDYMAAQVVAALGRLPTKAEWVAAGYPGIGGKHYAERNLTRPSNRYKSRGHGRY